MQASPTRLRAVAVAGSFAVLSLALGGASCDKKSVAHTTDPGPAVPFEAPARKEVKAEAAPSEAPKPAAPSAASDTPQQRFAMWAEKLPSPCGKAESLKKTLESGDASCKQAPFAKRFVEHLIQIEAGEDETEELYRNRFGKVTPRSFTLRETPFSGKPGAPVTIVEFYDYACPHCRDAAPILEQVIEQHPGDVVFYYKQYPLHRESVDLAKGALAAYRQGKFNDVHLKLFGAQNREDVFKIAEAAGLDMERFKKDYDDPALTAKIEADKQEGQKNDVKGTPTIFIGDRWFLDALTPEAMSDWIEEAIAVNR